MGIAILFVDDDSNLLQGIGRVVKHERKDISFVLCDNPREALETLSKSSFDAVVVDYRMPDMDGITLLEKISGAHPSVKRILLTGQSETEVFDRASKIVHQYIAKPCDTLELIRVVEELVKDEKK